MPVKFGHIGAYTISRAVPKGYSSFINPLLRYWQIPLSGRKAEDVMLTRFGILGQILHHNFRFIFYNLVPWSIPGSCTQLSLKISTNFNRGAGKTIHEKQISKFLSLFCTFFVLFQTAARVSFASSSKNYKIEGGWKNDNAKCEYQLETDIILYPFYSILYRCSRILYFGPEIETFLEEGEGDCTLHGTSHYFGRKLSSKFENDGKNRTSWVKTSETNFEVNFALGVTNFSSLLTHIFEFLKFEKDSTKRERKIQQNNETNLEVNFENRVYYFSFPSRLKFVNTSKRGWVKNSKITLQTGTKWIQNYGTKFDLKFQLGW